MISCCCQLTHRSIATNGEFRRDSGVDEIIQPNGGRDNELAVLSPDKKSLFVIDANGNMVAKRALALVLPESASRAEDYVSIGLVEDINGDGTDAIGIRWTDANELAVAFVNHQTTDEADLPIFRTKGLAPHENRGHASALKPKLIVDPDGNENILSRRLIAVTATSWQ